MRLRISEVKEAQYITLHFYFHHEKQRPVCMLGTSCSHQLETLTITRLPQLPSENLRIKVGKVSAAALSITLFTCRILPNGKMQRIGPLPYLP